MKKYVFFLIAFMTIFITGIKSVHAEEYQFYEAEYIDKMYMSKYEYATNTIYYQQARLFKSTSTKEIVYCIEPLIFFQEGSIYTATNIPRNLSQEQLDRIKKIAYFGYHYPGHWDSSWYAVAQLMIWRVASPNEGDYYFTKTLNGARTNEFDYQINEINQMIDNLDHEIPINNQTITLVKGNTQIIEVGDIINSYTTDNEEITIEDNHIKINELEEGEYSITLTRPMDPVFRQQFVLYGSPNSQYMLGRGDLDPNVANFKINVISNHIDIHKQDEDTNSFTPQGDASLIGSIYELYDEENNLIDTIEIKNETETIKDIPFGKYFLKEKTPGEGYTLNDTIYEINLSESSPNEELIVTNKVIKKNLTIHKQYGTTENLNPEKDIEFEIYNQNNEIVNTITTDENGEVEITLPYGVYKLIQKNSTEGYLKIEPLIIQINNMDEERIELKDYEIPVPDTHTSIWSYIWILIKNALGLC